MSFLGTIIVLAIAFVSLAYLYFKRSFSYWNSKDVPFIEPIIPHGNIKGLGKTVHFVDLLQKVYPKFKGNHKLCGLYFFAQPVTVLLDLELIKNVLVKDFANFHDRNMYYNDKDDPLSAHLVALDGKEWRDMRMKLTPTFTSGKMKYMFPTVVSVGDRFVNYMMEAIKENDEMEMKDILARFTMDVIGTCAFGIECNTLTDKDSEFLRMGRMAMEKPRHNAGVSFLINELKTLSRMLKVKFVRDDVSSFFLNVVEKTVEYREKNDIQRNDFMDLLIKLKVDTNDAASDASKRLTLNQIAAQSFLFFNAGYETATTTMLFTLYELAMNPDIQIKLRQEIRKTLKRHETFSYEAMMDMAYLDQTIKETLRKYPPFILIKRVANKDYKVSGTEIILEKGTNVLVPVYSIHHDPEYYPNPHKYDPERFSPEEVKKRNPMAWLAFGEGPRNCIAFRFGMIEARIGLINLLNNFEFSPCEETPISIEFDVRTIVLSAKDGIRLKVKPIATDIQTHVY